MGGGGERAKISRYGRCCFKIREVLFRDMKGAVSRYGRCCFEIWEVLNLLMRGGY